MRPFGEIARIQAITLDRHNAGHIAPLLLARFARHPVPAQLRQEDVFGGGDRELDLGSEDADRVEPAAVEFRFLELAEGGKEVELEGASLVDDVRRPPVPEGIAHVFGVRVVVRPEQGGELLHLTRRHLDEDVDVIRLPVVASERTRHRPAHGVPDFEPVERGKHPLKAFDNRVQLPAPFAIGYARSASSRP